MDSKDYNAVRAFAQKEANRTGRDMGIEINRLLEEFHAFSLPQAENRRGHELLCEVVHPENTDATALGHGYEATRKAVVRTWLEGAREPVGRK